MLKTCRMHWNKYLDNSNWPYIFQVSFYMFLTCFISIWSSFIENNLCKYITCFLLKNRKKIRNFQKIFLEYFSTNYLVMCPVWLISATGLALMFDNLGVPVKLSVQFTNRFFLILYNNNNSPMEFHWTVPGCLLVISCGLCLLVCC